MRPVSGRRRARRIISFFTLHFLRALWWEVLVRRLLGAAFVARGREARLRHVARRFRALAIELGGVMIKLGQFVSSRVDLLPRPVIQELAGLQDEVPPIPFTEIQTVLRQELGGRAEAIVDLSPTPLAAASFGQVYRARLEGERVVVKVQRPNIRALVETDLGALEVVARRGMRWRFIARRADLPALLEEFGRVLWEELDYLQEADHAERFAAIFANDSGVYVPAVYRAYSGRRVLVLEDVSAIKINDITALEAAGIDPKQVARRLLDTYLVQVFKARFFHADPHPGNIFVYPLPLAEGESPSPRPFYLIFVDFGMMGRLTPQVGEALRQTLIAAGLRDARGVVESYDKLGLLLPDADRERIIQATQEAFELVWGLDISQMTTLSAEDVVRYGGQFRDVFLRIPFRLPQDLIYLGRCAGILAGMCTALDPRFDPWISMQPYVKALLAGYGGEAPPPRRRLSEVFDVDTLRAALTEENLVRLAESARRYGERLITLPPLAESVLRRLERGTLSLPLDAQSQSALEEISHAQKRLGLALLSAGAGVAGALLWTGGAEIGGIGLTGLALILGLRWLLA